MSNDTVTNYSPYNMYQLYGYQYPAFKGAQIRQQSGVTQPVQTVSGVNLNTPPDTVTFSANKQIQTETKNGGLSKGAKWAIGIGTTVLAGVLAHRFIPPMRVQSRAQRVFLEDFTKEEANAIQKKYQDILKISDKDEFLDKLFKELKKDYKLDNIPIKLDKTYAKGTESGAIRGAAHFSPDHRKTYLELGVDKTYDNQTLLKHITHELRHAKQDVACYQVGTREDLISVYKDRIKDTISEKNWSQEELEREATEMVDEIIDFYSKIGIKKMNPDSRNYDWGRKILDSYRTYANKSEVAYRTTLYETEAKDIERLMDRMVNNRLF